MVPLNHSWKKVYILKCFIIGNSECLRKCFDKSVCKIHLQLRNTLSHIKRSFKYCYSIFIIPFHKIVCRLLIIYLLFFSYFRGSRSPVSLMSYNPAENAILLVTVSLLPYSSSSIIVLESFLLFFHN